jgi:hypothetical protein
MRGEQLSFNMPDKPIKREDEFSISYSEFKKRKKDRVSELSRALIMKTSPLSEEEINGMKNGTIDPEKFSAFKIAELYKYIDAEEERLFGKKGTEGPDDNPDNMR